MLLNRPGLPPTGYILAAYQTHLIHISGNNLTFALLVQGILKQINLFKPTLIMLPARSINIIVAVERSIGISMFTSQRLATPSMVAASYRGRVYPLTGPLYKDTVPSYMLPCFCPYINTGKSGRLPHKVGCDSKIAQQF